MAANKRKILEAARKHAQKGAKEKALKEFGKLLKLDPRDSKLRLEIGDTYRRWGQVEEAVEAYSAVADQFMQEGFDARAVAVFKQIQNLQPDSFTHYEPLAELYQRMGLTAEAIGCLESAAESYRQSGQKQEALGLLRKMAAIDPSNTTSRIKVADLLKQEEMQEEALAEYDAVITELELQGESETMAKVFERILEIDPERVETLAFYARNLIDSGSVQRAEALAKRALELDKSPERYELLAEVYRLEQREDELIALYRELAEVYRERGDEDRTREILQRYVPLDELGTAQTPNGYIDEDEKFEADEDLDELIVGDETTLLDGDLLSDDSLLVSDDDSGLGNLGGGGDLDELSADDIDLITDSNEMTSLLAEEPATEASSGGAGKAKPSIDASQLLAEASVYLRYGKRNQAIANLESILEHDGDHRLALEKLGEALAEGDDPAKAVEMWSRAAKLAAASGEGEAAEVLRTRIAALDSATAEALDLEVVSTPDTDERAIADDLIEDDSDELSIPGDFDVGSSDEGQSSQADADLPELDLADVSVSGMDLEIDVDDASFAQESPREAQTTDVELDTAGEESSTFDDVELEEISVDDVALDEEVEADADEVDSEAQTLAGAEDGNVSPDKIAEDLEEADFYLEQGLLDEAEAAYSRILSLVPNHPHAMVRLGELASQRGEAPGTVASAAEPALECPDEEESAPEDSAAGDIGADLADWQDDSFEEDARASSEQSTEDHLEDVRFEAPEDSEEAEEALEEDEPRRVAEALESNADVAAQSDLAADLGLDDPNDPISVPVSADTESASEDEQDATGEFPSVAVEQNETQEPQPEPTPDEPETMEPRDETIAASSETEDAQADPADAGDSGGFDLAAELSESFDQDPGASSSGASGIGGTSEDGFASVFAEFKKGVSETLTEGDHQAHYDLGIAYREMGLLNDAITELRLAMNDPERRIGCLHLMGMCAHDMGEHQQAIGHYTEALESGGVAEEMVLALKLDLGRSHEALGEIACARVAYEEIRAIDPDFADVASRLEQLENQTDGDSSDIGNQDTEEYETFDEFLGELADSDAGESDESGEVEPEASWETFDDVVADLDAEDDGESASEEATTTSKRRKKKISFV